MPIINDGQGNFAENRQEAVQMIIDHWIKTWNRFESKEDRQQKIEKTKKALREALTEAGDTAKKCCFKTRPNQEAFVTKARKASGSGGPDGWTSNEIKSAPTKAYRNVL